jgi:hypothetical protein
MRIAAHRGAAASTDGGCLLPVEHDRIDAPPNSVD